MAKRKSQAEHDAMVKQIASFLRSNDYKSIRADVTGFQPPAKIPFKNGTGYIPDVSAQGKRFNLFEIETADSIFEDHSRDEWTTFSRFADNNDAVFWVVVPTGSKTAADIRLMELELDARILEL
jgi:hypothetical protein